MEVALATGAVSRPFTVMTARGGDIAGEGLGTTTPSAVPQAEPLTNRYPMIAFSYDVDASRLVMLYRDPANGKTVSQIPTEAALKQYKEALKQEKDTERAAHLELTIGGDGSPARSGAGRGGTVPSKGGDSVPSFAPTSTFVAAAAVAGIGAGSSGFSGSSGHSGHSGSSGASARVNVVI